MIRKICAMLSAFFLAESMARKQQKRIYTEPVPSEGGVGVELSLM